MPDGSPKEIATETVILNPLRFQRQEAVASITSCAERCQLQVESIREKRRPLTVEIRVTVTGDPTRIKSFAVTVGGRQEHESRRARLRRWLGGIWLGVENSSW